MDLRSNLGYPSLTGGHFKMILKVYHIIGTIFSLGVGITIFLQYKNKKLIVAIFGLIVGILASIIFLGQFIGG